MKRKSVKKFYQEFVTELKTANPGKWYQMAKKIGAHSQTNDGDIVVDSLSGLSNSQAAQKIGEHFARISNEYDPIDNAKLPCYLPAPKPPQVTKFEVDKRLRKIK